MIWDRELEGQKDIYETEVSAIGMFVLCLFGIFCYIWYIKPLNKNYDKMF